MLTEDQKLKYENTRQMAKSELDQIERDIEGELARVKEKLLELQQAKKAVKQIYDGCCIASRASQHAGDERNQFLGNWQSQLTSATSS